MKRNWLLLSMLVFFSALFVHQARAQKESHKEYAPMKIVECNDCHKGEGVSPTHDADWMRSHRVSASRAGSNCSQCHTQTYCLDCHYGGGIGVDLRTQNFGRDYTPKSHRSDFINIHPIKALDNPQNCYRCHDQQFCNQCHSRFPRSSFRIKSHLRSGDTQSYIWNSEHASESRRNLQLCQSCHPDGDVCIRCHGSRSRGGSGINPHPKNFKGRNILDRSDRACSRCHELR